MIRLATNADLPALVRMGLRFIEETEYRDSIDASPEALSLLMARMIETPGHVVFVSDDNGITGMIGMFVYSHPMSGRLVGAEAFWWVEPEHRGAGLALFDHAEAWAKANGAARCQMIAPNDRVAALYRRRGYRKIEEQFQRNL